MKREDPQDPISILLPLVLSRNHNCRQLSSEILHCLHSRRPWPSWRKKIRKKRREEEPKNKSNETRRTYHLGGGLDLEKELVGKRLKPIPLEYLWMY